MATTNVGVLCSGRGSNLMALIAGQLAGELPIEIKIVIADNQDALAITRAREQGFYASFVPRNAWHANRDGFERRLVEMLNQCEVELVVLAGFERIIGPVLLEAFPNRIINIHPALLPSFTGLNVWEKQTSHGVKLAGATAHFVDGGTDTGPIIIQGAVPVDQNDSPETLSQRILEIEHKILPQAVKWYAEGRLEISGRQVILKDAAKASGALIWPRD